MIRSLFLIPVCFLIIASCSHELDVVNKSNSDEKVFEKQSLSKTSDTDGFYVSENLLKKYLRFFCKNKTAEKIKPIAKNDEILAYYVQYANNEGWDLISADKRLSPILVSSDKGILPDNFEEISYLSPISGMLHSVIDIRKSNCNDENGIWNFLSPNSKYEKHVPVELKNKIATKAGNGLRGLGQGMWIAVDTIIVDTTISATRLINTNWAQDSASTSFFFNRFTPIKNNKHCPVGCGPVAVGQILYKYIKNNPGQNTIPDSATMHSNGSVSFGYYSTQAWGHLGEDANYNTTVFLSWLGSPSQMNADYQPQKTGTAWIDDTTMLRNYLNFEDGFAVNNSSSNSLKVDFCHILTSSIDNGSPIYVESFIGNMGHVFLIDCYTRSIYQYIIRYQFDPYHVITDDEFYAYPSWRFDWPNNYDPDKDTAQFDEYINMNDNILINMNWGWGVAITVPDPDNPGTNYTIYPNTTSFNIYSRTHFIGENGTSYDYDNINFNWAITPNNNYNGVSNFVYNFSLK